MNEAYYEILKDSNDVDELYDAITDIGKVGLSKYASNVVPFLDHDLETLRVAAVLTLGFRLNVPGLGDKFFEMARDDEDSLIRKYAMDLWRTYARNDNLGKRLPELYSILENESNTAVCVEALCAFKEFVGAPFDKETENYILGIRDWPEFEPHLDLDELKKLLFKSE